MKQRKKKVELVKCNNPECINEFDNNKPPFAIIAFPMKLFCSMECLEATTKGK